MSRPTDPAAPQGSGFLPEVGGDQVAPSVQQPSSRSSGATLPPPAGAKQDMWLVERCGPPYAVPERSVGLAASSVHNREDSLDGTRG